MSSDDPFWTPWIENTVPDAVNEAGVKFWRDKSMQQWAQRKGLETVRCMFAETLEGYRARIVTEHGEILHESQQMEGTACFLDALKMSRQ